MICYLTNRMGPFSTQWYLDKGYAEYGEEYCSKCFQKTLRKIIYHRHWACGRIDVYGSDYGIAYGEISVPVMSEESWRLLSEWCRNYKTEEIDRNILNTFQNDTGHVIEWESSV